jgi:hypothetical protein
MGIIAKERQEQAVEATLDAARAAFCEIFASKEWPSVVAAKELCQPNKNDVESLRALLLGRCDLVFRDEITPRVNEAVAMFTKCHDVQRIIVNFIQAKKVFTPTMIDGSKTVTVSVSEAVNRLREFLSGSNHVADVQDGMRSRFMQYVMLRYARYQLASAKIDSVRKMVDRHVQSRSHSAVCWLSTDIVDSSILCKILGHLSYRSAASYTRSCSSLYKLEMMREMVPHLSVRNVIGIFPHSVSGSNALVSKRSVTHIYVDLAIKGVLLGNDAHDASTTTLAHSGEEPCGMTSRLVRSAYEADCKNRRIRHAPEEIVSRGHFRRRIVHDDFFSTPIQCEYQLVFADTLKVVDSNSLDPALNLSKMMRKLDAPTQTYTSMDGQRAIPYPAHVSFTINDLSKHYCRSQEFKIKVTGTAMTRANDRNDKSSVYQQTLIAYSTPFKLMSNKSVGVGQSGVKRRKTE